MGTTGRVKQVQKIPLGKEWYLLPMLDSQMVQGVEVGHQCLGGEKSFPQGDGGGVGSIGTPVTSLCSHCQQVKRYIHNTSTLIIDQTPDWASILGKKHSYELSVKDRGMWGSMNLPKPWVGKKGGEHLAGGIVTTNNCVTCLISSCFVLSP